MKDISQPLISGLSQVHRWEHPKKDFCCVLQNWNTKCKMHKIYISFLMNPSRTPEHNVSK